MPYGSPLGYASGEMKKGQKKFDEKRQEVFLRNYRETGLFNVSARAAAVCPETVRDRRRKDKGFDKQIEEALQDYREIVEQEVRTRAVDGWDEPVYYKGDVVGHINKKSDRMLELHVKRHIPEYRERQSMDLNVTGGVLVVPGEKMSAENWEKRNRKGETNGDK